MNEKHTNKVLMIVSVWNLQIQWLNETYDYSLQLKMKLNIIIYNNYNNEQLT